MVIKCIENALCLYETGDTVDPVKQKNKYGYISQSMGLSGLFHFTRAPFHQVDDLEPSGLQALSSASTEHSKQKTVSFKSA